MRTIFKFPLTIVDRQEITLSLVKWLHVSIQHGDPVIWAIVDQDKPKITHTLFTRGTGHPMTGEEGEYVGTLIVQNDQLVFHIFGDMTTVFGERR